MYPRPRYHGLRGKAENRRTNRGGKKGKSLFLYATREKSLVEERRKVKVLDEGTGISENLFRVSLLRNSPVFFIRLRVKVENETGRKGRGYIVEVVTRNSSLRSRLRLGAPPVGCSFYDFTETFTSGALLPPPSRFFFLPPLRRLFSF